MRRTNKIILMSVLVEILLVGIGYAAIQNITLNISSQAQAVVDQGNFIVKFIGTPQVSDTIKVSAEIIDNINARMNVTGLSTKGEKVSATYDIQNASTNLSADLSVSTTNNNTEYFIVRSQLAKSTLTAGETTTVTVEIELEKTPITENVNATIEVQIVAVPVQPGEEGSSGTTNAFSQTPAITNANIGDYIDIGNNIIGTSATTDDWRILYKDENYIHVILADYLPAEKIPTAAGLSISDNPYNVFLDDTLIDGLLNTTAWSSFTNRISGATAIGSPTAELLMNSYNTKSGTNLDYTQSITLNNNIEDYDLYVPHVTGYNLCYGYCLATPYIGGATDSYWVMSCSGMIRHDYLNSEDNFGIRPVVSIPSNTTVKLVDGVWSLIYNRPKK